MKVRFCKHNKGTARVVLRLRETFPHLDVKVKDCIRKCGPCHKTPFSVVEGRTVCGIDGEDLYKKVVKALSESS